MSTPNNLKSDAAQISAGKPTAQGGGTAPLAGLSLAALGVVYGDIGTSPIYALRESLHGAHGVATTGANVLGLLSLSCLGLGVWLMLQARRRLAPPGGALPASRTELERDLNALRPPE